jgi:hypothetical protein
MNVTTIITNAITDPMTATPRTMKPKARKKKEDHEDEEVK